VSTGVISRTLARFDSDQPLSQRCTRASRASLGVPELQLLGRLILVDDTLYLDQCVDYLAVPRSTASCAALLPGARLGAGAAAEAAARAVAMLCRVAKEKRWISTPPPPFSSALSLQRRLVRAPGRIMSRLLMRMESCCGGMTMQHRQY